MGEINTAADDDLLLKNFFAEVSEVERDNEVVRWDFTEPNLHCPRRYNDCNLVVSGNRAADEVVETMLSPS
ncbi:hypothetical protein Acr_26g0010000 [Actinidia rufa]|uniref:Uncharacterized protein n=1 Tax=Actinidia rufa TaxID=165716 RepID=A0A7J0H3Q7_9ERIC|nr:hypothetical protein Acr_26g0010000 [Actinidia rufa]